MDYRKGLGLIGSACVGAGMMYLMDPNMGKRRRSLIRDQFVHANKKITHTIQGRAEDAKNRLYGLYCETKSLLGSSCETVSGPIRNRRTG